MPSSRTEATDALTGWIVRVSRGLAAITIVLAGWTHGVLFVEGGSMEPALQPGDLIVYRRLGVRPSRGDMVVFDHAGTLVVHRVIGVQRDGALRTMGDANASLDREPVEPSSVVGTVTGVVPSGRWAERLAGLAH